MVRAKDLMTATLVSVDPDDTVESAISLMLAHSVSTLPVIDGSNRLLGIVSEFDLLDLAFGDEKRNRSVFAYMTRQLHTVNEDEPVGTVAETFRLFGVQSLPVMREGRLVGIVSRVDVLRHLRDETAATRRAAW